MPETISYSVGRNGLNRSGDVKVVQRFLNGTAGTGAARLKDDGAVGPLTLRAIEAFQAKVLGWSGRAVDGTVEPGRTTWKALNGNVVQVAGIKPHPSPRSAWQDLPQAPPATKPGTQPKLAGDAADPYTSYRQGSYKEALGGGDAEKNQTIARYGCALCTLTMAATYLGTRTKHWPADLKPKNLTPHQANAICRKAGAFSGFQLAMGKAATALGMTYEEYGFAASLEDGDIDLIDAHLKSGKPVAANVDYKKGSGGDHWILVTGAAGAIYSAIDPATGQRMELTNNRDGKSANARYETTRKDRTGILFGFRRGAGKNNHQDAYVVVRFACLDQA